MKVRRSFVRHALGTTFVGALGLAASSSACNERFQFDVAGAGGSASAGVAATSGSAGASFSGMAGSVPSTAGDSAFGGAGGSASAGTAGAGAVAGTDGLAGGGTGPATCGDVGVCPEGLHCADGVCAQCEADADCAPYALARCEPTRHRCVPCVTTADCETGFACDSLANRCLKKCVDDLGCAGQHGCDEHRLVCYQCDEDRECATSSIGSLCASDGSGCVQCRKDTDCQGQHCDQLLGRCVECRDGLDCASHLCSATTFTCLPN